MTGKYLDYHVERAQSLFKKNTFSTCNWYFADTSIEYQAMDVTGGCHGRITNCPPNCDVLISSLYQIEAHVIRSTEEDAFTYWDEILPYFHKVMKVPYVKGDKFILLDPNNAGNHVIMACIVSRQPWECSSFLDTYFKFRKTFTPIYSLLAANYLIRTSTIRYPELECDVFGGSVSLEYLNNFIDYGELNYKSRDLKTGTKSGVFQAFRGGKELIHVKDYDAFRRKVNDSLTGSLQRGAFGRQHQIEKAKIDRVEEFKDILLQVIHSNNVKEKYYLCAD